MEHKKFSLIAHQNHLFYSPISENKIDKIIHQLRLPPESQAADFGCGNCEVLIRIIEKYKAFSIGIDQMAENFEEAKKRTPGRIDHSSLTMKCQDANEFVEELPPASLDLGVCIGSTHVFGRYLDTLKVLKKYVKRHKLILIGEGYWQQRPDREYLDFLGGDESLHQSHCKNIEMALEQGLIPLFAYTTNKEEWDDYEWLYSRTIEDYCLLNPEDPDRQAMLDKISKWRYHYLKWGRDTLGFGLYLFRNG